MRHLFAIFTIVTAASVAALNPSVPTAHSAQTQGVRPAAHSVALTPAFHPVALAVDPLADRTVEVPNRVVLPEASFHSDVTYQVGMQSAVRTGEQIAQERHAFLQAERDRIAEEARKAEEARILAEKAAREAEAARNAEEARKAAERAAAQKAEADAKAAAKAVERTTRKAASDAVKARAATPPPASRSGNRSAIVTEGGAEGAWAALRKCESGGNYATNTGNGYYGAYQFSAQTWRALGYSGLPSDNPPAVQDEAAAKLQARSGWGQWPACSRKLGLR